MSVSEAEQMLRRIQELPELNGYESDILHKCRAELREHGSLPLMLGIALERIYERHFPRR